MSWVACEDTIPNLSRSALHRCLQRHGISRLPVEETTGAAQAVQDLRDRLRPHRQLRAAPRRRQAGHVPRHRPGLEVHLRRVPRQRRQDGRLGLPQATSWRSSPTRSTPCSPTTAWPSPTCPRTGSGPSRRFLGPHIFDRVCIEQRHRAPADQALSPVDQRPGRADEPHDQGRHGQGLPLRRPGKPQGPCPGLRHRLQLRQAPQGAEMANTLSGHLRGLDESTRQSSRSTRTTSSRDHTPSKFAFIC